MLEEARARLKNSDEYSNEILEDIGHFFINPDPERPVIELQELLQEIGRFVIQKIKGEPVTISRGDLVRIATIMRWNTTEKRNGMFLTVAMKGSNYALEKLEEIFTRFLREQDPRRNFIGIISKIILLHHDKLPCDAFLAKMENSKQPACTAIHWLNKTDANLHAHQWREISEQTKTPDEKVAIMLIEFFNTILGWKRNTFTETVGETYERCASGEISYSYANESLLEKFFQENNNSTNEMYADFIKEVQALNSLLVDEYAKFCEGKSAGAAEINDTNFNNNLRMLSLKAKKHLALMEVMFGAIENFIKNIHDLRVENQEKLTKILTTQIIFLKTHYQSLQQYREIIKQMSESFAYLRQVKNNFSLPLYKILTEKTCGLVEGLQTVYLDYERLKLEHATYVEQIGKCVSSCEQLFSKINISYNPLLLGVDLKPFYLLDAQVKTIRANLDNLINQLESSKSLIEIFNNFEVLCRKYETENTNKFLTNVFLVFASNLKQIWKPEELMQFKLLLCESLKSLRQNVMTVEKNLEELLQMRVLPKVVTPPRDSNNKIAKARPTKCRNGNSETARRQPTKPPVARRLAF